jgi:hypothetical protein
LDDSDDTFQFVGVEVSGTMRLCWYLDGQQAWRDIPFVEINISLLADQIGVPTTNALDLGQGVHYFAFAINVSVEETENVL